MRRPAPDLHAPFRPHLGRLVPAAVGLVWVGVLGALGVASLAGGTPVAAAGLLLLASGGGMLLWRFAAVRAEPGPEGLLVRNLVHSRLVPWPGIVAVFLDPAATWAHLDLADGTTLEVMAIQRSDGARADAEAVRLATLVDRYSIVRGD